MMDGSSKSGLSSWAIRKPIPTIVLFLALAIAGWMAFVRLPVNANPNVSFPIVNVTVSQPGAAPAELELQVTRRIEGAVAGLAGVRHVQSSITNGVSETTVEFRIGVDPDRGTNDVRDAIAQIRADLPQNILEPTVSRVDVEGDAILYYVIEGPDLSLIDLSWYVEDTVARELLTVPGVQRVQRIGGAEREIRVDLDPDRLAALNVTADQINAALRALNTDLPGGLSELGRQEQSIRTVGTARTVAELAQRQLPLPDGRRVRLGDIGEVRDGAAEPRSLARFDGEEVVGFSVFRAKGSSDTVVAEGVARKLEELQGSHEGARITEIASTVEYTLESYEAAMHTLIEGALLTVVVVFLFLRDWRATVIAALAMPLSILPTFAAMDQFGFTLNSVSLLALTLVIGILVDDAIVEIENIDRHIHMGKRPYLAAIDAADAIGLAVVATTLTIVAVFLPVSFIGGVVGQYFRQFGLTVAVAVLASLLVARLLTPLMAAYFMQPNQPQHSARPARFSLMQPYLRLLSWTLDHRLITLGAAALIFIGSLLLIPLLPTGFLPVSDSNLSQLRVELAPGARLADTERLTNRIALEMLARPEVEHVLVSAENVHEALVLIRLKPRNERGLTRKEFEQRVRSTIVAVPDIRFGFLADGGAKDVSIYLASDDGARLADAARRVEAEMRGLTQIANVQSTEPLPQPELLFRPRFEEAGRLGVSVESIGTAARIATIGDIDANSAKFNLSDRQVPIRVRIDPERRRDIETLRALRVGRDTGGAVPLTSVADIDFGAGDTEIRRFDRKRQIAIEADLNGVPLGAALDAINDLPALRNLPESVAQIKYGDAEYMEEMFENFALAIGTGILLMLAVLVLLFKDFLQPITIFVALPLSICGAMLALLLYGGALDLSSTIGALMLMGIVGKNSILLVDFAIEGRNRGLSPRDALIEAGRMRTRPIIMTTVAMIAGMAPAALGIGADAGFRAPMAVAVIGGLIASTLLSLVFVPVVFTAVDDVGAWLARRLSRITSVTDEDRRAGQQAVALVDDHE